MHEPIDTIKDLNDKIASYEQAIKHTIDQLELIAHSTLHYPERVGITTAIEILKANTKDIK